MKTSPITKKWLTATLLSLTSLCVMAQTIEVKYNGGSATVKVPAGVGDVDYTTDGAHVSIASATSAAEYTYSVSGATTDGSLTISGSYKLTLELNGVDIASKRGAAIDVQCGKRIAVKVAEGTVNTLADCANGKQKAAMYFTGHPEFDGAGTLTVTGKTAHAISAKEYLLIKKGFGTLNILGAVKDGIHCGKEKVAAWDEEMVLNEHEFFRCNGGVINIKNCAGDCIDAGNYGCMLIKGGSLNLSVTATDVCGMKSPNTFIMEDGQINIDIAGNQSDGIYINNQARFNGGELNIDVRGNGSKGIKGKQKASSGYENGGNVEFGGTQASIIAWGGDDNTDPADPSHCVGVSVDGNLVCSADVKVTAADEARGVTCDGTMTGQADVTKLHWYAHPSDFQYDMMVYVSLGNDCNAASGVEVAAFVDGECRGVAKPVAGKSGVYSIRILSNQTGGESVEFKMLNNGEEVELQSSAAVSFLSQSTVGTASAPVELSLESFTAYKLKKGWNWITPIGNETADPLALIAPIKGSVARFVGQTNELVNDPKHGIVGNMKTISPVQAYKLYVDADVTLDAALPAVDPATVEVKLAKGWNWMGYVLPVKQSLEKALAGLSAMKGDKIMSANAFAEYDGATWTGTLTHLNPGEGYMYYRAGGATSFHYSSK